MSISFVCLFTMHSRVSAASNISILRIYSMVLLSIFTLYQIPSILVRIQNVCDQRATPDNYVTCTKQESPN